MIYQTAEPAGTAGGRMYTIKEITKMTDTALITGSYGGLGRCFAEIHASRGGDLILAGRSPEKLEKQADEIRSRHSVRVETIVIDLSRPEAAGEIYDTCRQNGWSIEYLINNAGFGGQGDFTRDRSMEEDMEMIAVNIETPTRLMKLFLPDMVKQGRGRVLNVSSTAGIIPGPLQAVYYATKAYLSSVSNAIWRELKGSGVTVTALEPGAMTTGFAEKGGLTGTKMFRHTVDPMPVARDGYEGMMAGKMNVLSGLPGYQKPLMKLAPILPRKMIMDMVYDQQSARSKR